MLQEMVARILGADLGSYRHFVASMHLYDKNRVRARQYLDEGFQRHVEMPPMPEGDPRPAIRRLFDAERLVRARQQLDAGNFGLDSYWADLIRLLQIHFAQGNKARLDALQADLTHNCYRMFVDGQRSRNPLQSVEPAQGALPL